MKQILGNSITVDGQDIELALLERTFAELEERKQRSEGIPKELEVTGWPRKCPECSGTNIITTYDDGRNPSEIGCGDCGLVIDNRFINLGPEWRAFNAEEKESRSRVGAPMIYRIHDKGLSTVIDWKNSDTHGKILTPKQAAEAYNLRRCEKRTSWADGRTKTLVPALSEINKFKSRLNLPENVAEVAAVLYREAVKKHLVHGRSISGIAAGSIYMACRKFSVSRTLDEISKITCVPEKDIARSYRFLLENLDESVPLQQPKQLISKISGMLPYELSSYGHEILAAKILDSVGAKLTDGRKPYGMAAAATYVALILNGEKRTQRDIALAANVTEVTVRNSYKMLMKEMEIKVRL